MKNTVLLRAVIVWVVLGASGCSEECTAIIDRRFTSVGEQEVGLSNDGTLAMGHWQIVFDAAGAYDWDYSDVSTSGTYTCSGAGELLGTSGDAEYTGVFDLEADLLTWDGLEYQ